MICSAVCLVRFMVESPAQSGRRRTLIHPGPVSGVHVISSDNPYSESLFRTVMHRPDYLRRPFVPTQEEECSSACAVMDWFNHP